MTTPRVLVKRLQSRAAVAPPANVPDSGIRINHHAIYRGLSIAGPTFDTRTCIPDVGTLRSDPKTVWSDWISIVKGKGKGKGKDKNSTSGEKGKGKGKDKGKGKPSDGPKGKSTNGLAPVGSGGKKGGKQSGKSARKAKVVADLPARELEASQVMDLRPEHGVAVAVVVEEGARRHTFFMA